MTEALVEDRAEARPGHQRPDAPRRPEAPRHLRIVEPRSRARGNPGRGRLAFVAAAGLLITVAFGLVYLHVVLAQRQFQLDRLDTRLTHEQAAYESLRLQVAELDSPRQIISTAEGRLGMRQPKSVVYLSLPPGPSTPEPHASMAGGAGRRSASITVAPAGDADWPRIKADLAGST